MEDERTRIVRTITVEDGTTDGKQYHVDNYGDLYIKAQASMHSTRTDQTILTLDDNGVIMQKLS